MPFGAVPLLPITALVVPFIEPWYTRLVADKGVSSDMLALISVADLDTFQILTLSISPSKYFCCARLLYPITKVVCQLKLEVVLPLVKMV